MHFEKTELMAQDAMVNELMRPLAEYLAIPRATEIVINRPGQILVEVGAEWTIHHVPGMTMERCWSLVNAIASFAAQRIDAQSPLLSAQLPGGQRVQIVVPPACGQNNISITIRIPDSVTRTFAQYQADGFFGSYLWPRSTDIELRNRDLSPVQQKMVRFLLTDRFADFLTAAVRAKLNIVFVGDTGCGKTSLMKAACQHIPVDERLITIEDVRELQLENHTNRVHLLYSKGIARDGTVTPSDLIASAMRMKPDRVLLAELRGAEAFDFLKLLTTGHSGSISSFHAESCALARERYVFMCKEHPNAANYDVDDLKRLVTLTIDVIVHIAVVREAGDGDLENTKRRYVSEVYYDPVAKFEARFGAATVHRAAGLQ